MPTPLRSFIDVPSDSHFPLENLPFGVFKPKQGNARVGVAIGAQVLDLAALEEAGKFQAVSELQGKHVFAQDSLNAFLSLGRPAWSGVRQILQRLLSADTPELRDDSALRARAFHDQAAVTMQLPARIGDYTDFYSSYHHAHNVGTMLRGADNALMPNWKYLPVGYHGRASSVVVSGTEVRRPHGQTKPAEAEAPTFGPSRSFDFELETAFLIGPGNSLGEPIPIERAAEHIFGVVLMNDWSARDLQTWEYQPLGPFLAKNFCTSISPWVVTMEALEPFRKPLPPQDPVPLPYLRAAQDFAYDVKLEAYLSAPGVDGAASDYAHKHGESLLEHGAAVGSSHGERLQPAAGRSPRQWHDQRADGGFARLHAGVDLAGRKPARAPQWRDAEMVGRWRHAEHHRLGAGGRLSGRLRRSQRAHSPGALSAPRVILRLAKRAEGSHASTRAHTFRSRECQAPSARSLAVSAARDDNRARTPSRSPGGRTPVILRPAKRAEGSHASKSVIVPAANAKHPREIPHPASMRESGCTDPRETRVSFSRRAHASSS